MRVTKLGYKKATYGVSTRAHIVAAKAHNSSINQTRRSKNMYDRKKPEEGWLILGRELDGAILDIMPRNKEEVLALSREQWYMISDHCEFTWRDDNRTKGECRDLYTANHGVKCLSYEERTDDSD